MALISSNPENRFRPGPDRYDIAPAAGASRVLLVSSNPCNPTGVATHRESLRRLVGPYTRPDRAAPFDERLFEHDAAILPGRLCDMRRQEGQPSRLDRFTRFSFGPLSPDSYEDDMKILSLCI